jgi:site-specific recombinase XerD
LPKVKGRLFADVYGTFLKVFHSIGLDIPKGQASHVLRHTFATHYMNHAVTLNPISNIK